MGMPSLEDVRAAAARIEGRVRQTPVLTSATFDGELGCEVFFKCENLQQTGAFKLRGATNAVQSLSDAEAARGVIAHSSGNHAAALAWAARERGIPCHLVMPSTAAAIKVAATRSLGAEIVFCEEGERETTCAEVQRRTGATFIHPNDDPRVIAGQGTAALELLEQVEELDMLMTPVGGGGLLSGTAIVARGWHHEIEILGAEPEVVDDAYRSLQSGVRQAAVAGARSCADGLLTGLGELDFAILQGLGVEIVTVSEAAILEAARDFLERMKIVVEPSSATCLAALRRIPERLESRRVGVILSGGNTDLAWLTPRRGESTRPGGH